MPPKIKFHYNMSLCFCWSCNNGIDFVTNICCQFTKDDRCLKFLTNIISKIIRCRTFFFLLRLIVKMCPMHNRLSGCDWQQCFYLSFSKIIFLLTHSQNIYSPSTLKMQFQLQFYRRFISCFLWTLKLQFRNLTAQN